MFVGHYAASFLSKFVAPSLPLWLLFLAAQLVDLCWDALILLGIEKARIVPGFNASNNLDLYYMPFTHSLSSTLIWSVGTAVIYRLFRPGAHSSTAAIVLGLTTGAHWILDLVVHVPDLPLWFDSHKVGFGLWNMPRATVALEIGIVWMTAVLARSVVVPAAGTRMLLLAALLTGIQLLSTVHQPTQLISMVAQLFATYIMLAVVAWWAELPNSKRRAAP
jgi:hypothetical protein